jgi:ABC-2 type transport system ATP-binding protein
MEDIRRLCKRVIIIDRGELIYDGNYRELIERHADTKTIEMVLSEPIAREALERFGTITDFRDTSCRLTVPRKRVTEVTTELLKKFPIDDISIHEESMEEVVRGIFVTNKK